MEEKNMESKEISLRKKIEKLKNSVTEYQEEENKWVEEIKFLSTIREKMARTAS
jgi:hypothetical protein